MSAASRNHEVISILALGRNRDRISEMLTDSALQFDCDWIEQEEDTLRENYHDVALVCLGDRSRAHLSPIGERERRALSLLCSTGIPAVIVGPESVRRLLEGTDLNWDWRFISENELDTEHLLQGVHDALEEYLSVSERPTASHRFEAWMELEDCGFAYRSATGTLRRKRLA